MRPSYPDHVRKTQWYRPDIDRAVIAALSERGSWFGVAHVIAYFILVAVLGLGVVATWWSWWSLPLLLVYGNVWSLGSVAMEHEALHGNLVPTKRANRVLAHIGGYMCGLEATRYRWTHFGHHNQTLSTEDPRDFEILGGHSVPLRSLALNLLPFGGLVRPGKNFWYMHREVARNATGKLSTAAKYGVRADKHRELIRNARVHTSLWLTTVVASIVVWSPLPALLLFLPTWYGSTLTLLCGLPQHAGLPPNVPDHRRNTRSFTTNPIISFLYFGMEYHVEHHLFPNVPSRRLPELHAMLADQLPAPRRGLIGAWREVLPALQRRQQDPAWFLDLQVPESAPGASAN